MSVSQYRGDVDRLTKEIADLRRRAADERSRSSAERSNALRVQSSITRTSSASSIQSKLRQAQRHEEQANRSERNAADFDRRAAQKQQALSTAQKNLDRALDAEQRKAQREARRRDDENRRRLRELESAQRAAHTLQPWQSRPVGPSAPTFRHVENPAKPPPGEYEYDVCLSFAGEDRSYVEMIAGGLKVAGLRVFYDADEVVKLWGKDLAEHFDHVYRKASRFCVMFVSAAYAEKSWTRHERRSALSRAVDEEAEYILPARFDDTELDGLRPTVGFVDLREFAPETVVTMLVEKVVGPPVQPE